MPRPRTDGRYAERVAVLAEEGWRPAAIFRIIRDEAREKGWGDCPGERTIRRLYLAHQKLPEHVRRENAPFRWPRSMESGLLPWEAARAALDLLRYRDEERMGRPTVRQAKWYWRLTLAAPTIDPWEANHHAAWLAGVEFARLISGSVTFGGKEGVNWSAIEWSLAYQPWRSDADKEAYRAAASREADPIPVQTGGAIGPTEAARFQLEASMGRKVAEEIFEQMERRESDGGQARE